MNNTQAHDKLLNEVMFLLGSDPRIRVWKRKVGFATPLGGHRPIMFGIKGEADLQFIVSPSGRMGSVEIKTGSGKLSKEQELWKQMIIKFGGAYLECRSLEEACKFKEELLGS